MQLGGAPPNQPPPTKNLQRSPCRTLPKEVGTNLTYESIISPSLSSSSTAPVRQYPPTATHFPVLAGYRQSELPMEREKKALLPPCNYQISQKNEAELRILIIAHHKTRRGLVLAACYWHSLPTKLYKEHRNSCLQRY